MSCAPSKLEVGFPDIPACLREFVDVLTTPTKEPVTIEYINKYYCADSTTEYLTSLSRTWNLDYCKHVLPRSEGYIYYRDPPIEEPGPEPEPTTSADPSATLDPSTTVNVSKVVVNASLDGIFYTTPSVVTALSDPFADYTNMISSRATRTIQYSYSSSSFIYPIYTYQGRPTRSNMSVIPILLLVANYFVKR